MANSASLPVPGPPAMRSSTTISKTMQEEARMRMGRGYHNETLPASNTYIHYQKHIYAPGSPLRSCIRPGACKEGIAHEPGDGSDARVVVCSRGSPRVP